ncbi:MAG: LssY C-terminal domain-containing protein [Ktedonobacterales bacterium]
MEGSGDLLTIYQASQLLRMASTSPAAIIGAVIIAVLLLLFLIGLFGVIRTMRRVRELSKEGRRVSAAAAVQHGSNPVTSFNRDGVASDPINVKLTATAGQLAAAFSAGGWYRADEIDFITSARISYDSILARKYATAPVSNLYLYGRREDYAFELPGNSVRERDHARFWDTGTKGDDGRSIWVGGATRDIKVEISPVTHLPTHKISSDVDAERTNVADCLALSGWVIREGWEASFGKPTEQRNSLGDMYYTDGRRAVLTLANIPVFAPLFTHTRGRLGAKLAQTFARAAHWRLPKEGLERAARRRQESKLPSQ